jgi:uncharacterized LabA/DUF88 family protein
MTAPAPPPAGVGLFIDFENLVRGLGGQLDLPALVRAAREHGPLMMANAYADWRDKEMNQHQTRLYSLGIDLIHVLGRLSPNGHKNAVDVKMAVDVVESIFATPHLGAYVIISGDRDFIHVLKVLRRHGKRVVGLSPENSASRDFAALCDHFTEIPAPRPGAPPPPPPRPGCPRRWPGRSGCQPWAGPPARD